jgi:hypothetical protein
MEQPNHAVAATANPPRQPMSPRNTWLVVGAAIIVLTMLVFLLGPLFQAADNTLDPTPTAAPPVTVATITAEGVMGDLRAHGFVLTEVVRADDVIVPDAYDARIDGVEAGVLAFADEGAREAWGEALVQLGGIAVVGELWAVTLDSDGSGGTPYRRSQELAYQISQAVGGDIVDTTD